MIWYLCFFLSLIILSISAFYAWTLFKKRKKKGFMTPLNALMAGAFLAILTGLIPVYTLIVEKEKGFFLNLILMDAIYTLQVFSLNAGTEIISEYVSSAASPISGLYSNYMSILFFAAPFLTFGFVISLFQNAFSSVRLLLHFKDDVYVFSKLNEKTMILARSIKTNHPESVIVFCDVEREEDEALTQDLEAAEDLGAILFKTDIVSLNLVKHSANSALKLICMSEEESTNLLHALKLIEKYKERKNTDLYVFSSKPEGELLLNDSLEGTIKVRRINPIRSLVYNYLYEQGEEILSMEIPEVDGIRKVNAVILGLGRYGSELLKALSWFTQMPGFVTEIHAYDIDPLAEEKFAAMCPELLSEKLNGVHIPGESEYTIRIHSGVDLRTRQFAESFASLEGPTIVFICLGDDSENISQAAYLRMLCARKGCETIIRTVVYNTEESNLLSFIKNHRGQEYMIKPIGNLESMYSEKILLEGELEKIALERHLKYDPNGEKNFWMVEYNYRSSMASALHRTIRMKLHIPGAEKTEEQWTESERFLNEELEHKRWNAYVRSEGFIYSGSKEKSSRNDLAKIHHLLFDYHSLPEEEKRKDGRVGSI